jgi:hypothetical protein
MFQHSIRNGVVLSEKQLTQVSSLPDHEKMSIIRAMNSTIGTLSEFVNELLASLNKRVHAEPVTDTAGTE